MSQPPQDPAPGYGPPPEWQSGQGGGQQPSPWAPGPAPGSAPGPGVPQPWSGPAQTSSKAIVALVLALVSYTVVPFLAAVAAIVLAQQAKREIAASGGRLGGAGLATAAFWLGVVNCVLAALTFLAFALFLGVFGLAVF